MHAPAFHCPSCGGPQARGGPGRCDFCGSVRVPLGVADPRTAKPCPQCTTLVADDHRFCPQCGGVQGEAGPPDAQSDHKCPGCEHSMAIWALDPQLTSFGYRGSDPQILGCQRCGGAWVDRRTLDAIIAESAAHAINADERAIPRRTMAMTEVVVYRPCPSCGERMNRRNFGRYSGIVVDECHGCGTFFDAGELEGVVAFVRAGGLALSKRRDAEIARRDLAVRQQLNATPGITSRAGYDLSRLGSDYYLLVLFVRWMSRWIRRIAR